MSDSGPKTPLRPPITPPARKKAPFSTFRGAKGILPPDQASLAQVGPENLVISALKAAEDGQGLIVRVLETAGRPAEGSLTLPLTTITSAVECNAVEDCGGALASDAHRVRFRMAPHQVRTIRVLTK